jgi:hypothetical protein
MLVQIKNSKKKTNKAKIEREATVRMMCLSPVTIASTVMYAHYARQPNNQNSCLSPNNPKGYPDGAGGKVKAMV